MGEGLEQVRASGENLRQVIAVIQETSGATRTITTHVTQQGVGIQQLAASIRELSAGMDATVAALERTERATSTVQAASRELVTIVNGFRV